MYIFNERSLIFVLLIGTFAVSIFFNSCNQSNKNTVTSSFVLDHNRMLVKAEIQKKDGTWKKILLWVDSGNPDFLISRQLALEAGFISDEDSAKVVRGELEINTPISIKTGEMELDYSAAKSIVIFKPFWVFGETHADATIPSTVLMKYDVAFNYPGKEITFSKPGTMKFRGTKIPININPSTGILQIDGMLGSDSISFALDNGASFTFGSTEFLENLKNKYPGLPLCAGAVGYANMWGWGLNENSWIVTHIPKIAFGTLILENVGITIPPDYNDKGYGMMDWYSKKTYKPVNGFLGPNSFKDFKVGIDYVNREIYFEGQYNSRPHDMDIVGITLRPQENGTYVITGTGIKNETPLVREIQSGDLLIRINDFNVKNETMGNVVDALRGIPGEIKHLTLQRNGRMIDIEAKVQSIL